jgi:hypothetical protein
LFYQFFLPAVPGVVVDDKGGHERDHQGNDVKEKAAEGEEKEFMVFDEGGESVLTGTGYFIIDRIKFNNSRVSEFYQENA